MASIGRITIADATPEFPRHDAPSIVELKDGRLFLAWMQHTGSKEHGNDQAPCDIASMISEDGGHTWKDRKILVKNNPGDINIHFPSLLRLANGEIFFFYQRRHELAKGAPQKSTAYVCWSRDECESFSEPIEHQLIRKTNRSSDEPVQISTGRIVMPFQKLEGGWAATRPDGGATDQAYINTTYSDDNGRSWKEGKDWITLPLRGAMEPRIAELRDGRLLMTMRTQLGAVFKCESSDQGISWSKPQCSGLKAPESMPMLSRIPKTGDLILIWNDGIYEPGFDHFGRRTPLTVAISKDEGKTWTNFKNLETARDYEFTNPWVFFTSKNKVIISYIASKMQNPDFPGRFGRSIMPLKAVIADLEWLYE